MKVTFTTFPNHSAMRLERFDWDIEDFIGHLQNSTGFKSKFECPWVKMAIFGNVRTPKNSLRHDRNIIKITGVEGDYDGEQVTIEQAVEMLEKAGIKAIVYSSPSHTAEKPRWRVIAPCSTQHPPHMRSVFMGRVNGALGGILSPESFTLSQSYYYGQVEGAEYQLSVTWDNIEEGDCIDELESLDEIAIFKKPMVHSNEGGGAADYSLNMFELAVTYYGRLLKTGDNRRALLKSYIASRSNRGLVRDEVMALVKSACDRYFDPSDPMDSTNIEEMANHYAEIDKEKTDQPVDLSIMLKAISAQAKQTVQELPPKEIEPQSNGIPAPYPGAMQAIVQASLVSAFKPQPELATLAALIAMSSSINGEYSTASGGRFNLYGIGALESGGGKDNPRSVAEAVSGASGSITIGRPSSGAAIEDKLISRKNILMTLDEMSFMLAASNDDKAPAHLKDLVAVLLKLYSASRGAYFKRVKAAQLNQRNDEPQIIANPCLSILGFSTVEGFAKAFSESNLVDGLMGRMLFVKGRQNVKPQRPKNPQEVPAMLMPIINAMQGINPVAQAGMGASIGGAVVGETKQATDLLNDLLSECEFDRDRTLTVAKSLYARSYEKIERIAGVLAVWDDPTNPIIEVDHIEWAKQFVYASDASILQFVQNEMQENLEIQNAEKLRELIKKILSRSFKSIRDIETEAIKVGCVSRSQLLRLSKMKAQDFNQALTRLHDLGEVLAVDEKGKKLPIIREIDVN